MRGIDVSHYQTPGTFPYAALRAAGFEFNIINATEGRDRDKAFLEHWRRTIDAGMVPGAYHFFRQNVELAAQLDTFLEAMQAVSYGPHCIIPVLDLEKGPDRDGPVRPELFNAAETMADSLRTAYGDCMLYGGVSFWSAIGKPRWWRKHPLWVSHYTAASEPLTPGDAPWLLWQFASKPVPGLYSSKLDQNIARGLPMVAAPKLVHLSRDAKAELADRDATVRDRS